VRKITAIIYRRYRQSHDCSAFYFCQTCPDPNKSPQSHRATEPQSHRATEPQRRKKGETEKKRGREKRRYVSLSLRFSFPLSLPLSLRLCGSVALWRFISLGVAQRVEQ
jgi:hypothetical protein